MAGHATHRGFATFAFAIFCAAKPTAEKGGERGEENSIKLRVHRIIAIEGGKQGEEGRRKGRRNGEGQNVVHARIRHALALALAHATATEKKENILRT